jgi:hypothetical protein
MSKTLTAGDYRRVAVIQAKIDLLEAKKQKVLAGVTVGKKAAKAGTKKGKKPASDARTKAQTKRRNRERREKKALLAAAKKTGEKKA